MIPVTTCAQSCQQSIYKSQYLFSDRLSETYILRSGRNATRTGGLGFLVNK